MTEIRMLRKDRGAPGFKETVTYEAGWQGDVPEHLAKAFCDEMTPPAAVRVEAKAVAAAPENKMLPAAEGNKAAAPAPAPEPAPVEVPAEPAVEPVDGDEPDPEGDDADEGDSAPVGASGGRRRRV